MRKLELSAIFFEWNGGGKKACNVWILSFSLHSFKIRNEMFKWLQCSFYGFLISYLRYLFLSIILFVINFVVVKILLHHVLFLEVLAKDFHVTKRLITVNPCLSGRFPVCLKDRLTICSPWFFCAFSANSDSIFFQLGQFSSPIQTFLNACVGNAS